MTTYDILITVTLCSLISMVASMRNNNYYGYNGRSFAGNQFCYGGRGWYYAYCPDGTRSPNNCVNTGSCSQFPGYTCVRGGICCRSSTVGTGSNVCPTGLASQYQCVTQSCASGLVCVSGVCCMGATSGTCPNGGLGIGECVTTESGLTCGDGFTCVAVGQKNLCCPTSSNPTEPGQPTNTDDNVCANGAKASGYKCFAGQPCPSSISLCFNGNCCPESSMRRAVTQSLCKNGDPTGLCSNSENKTCLAGHSCTTIGFCCAPVPQNVTQNN